MSQRRWIFVNFYILFLALCSAFVLMLVYLDDCTNLYTLSRVPFEYYKLCDVFFNLIYLLNETLQK